MITDPGCHRQRVAAEGPGKVSKDSFRHLSPYESSDTLAGSIHRPFHFASFAVFVLALVHGLFSGTDSGGPWARRFYLAAGGSVLFLSLYRLSPPGASYPLLRSSPALEGGLTGVPSFIG